MQCYKASLAELERELSRSAKSNPMAECHLCTPPNSDLSSVVSDVATLKSGVAKLYSGNLSGVIAASTTASLGSIALQFVPSAMIIRTIPHDTQNPSYLSLYAFSTTGKYQVWKNNSGSGTRPTVWMQFNGSLTANFVTDIPNYSFSFNWLFLAFR